ncbi:hypothetical protein C6A85_000000116360 [Mycobacterium sp. ITM-2017-0098]|nr:hypothetical protein C6A85_000000116360 [Mycobacterium sp. ITM-2017-0098]
MAVATTAGTSIASADTGDSSTSAASSSTSANTTTANTTTANETTANETAANDDTTTDHPGLQDTDAADDTGADDGTDGEDKSDESDGPAQEVDEDPEEPTTAHSAKEPGSESSRNGHATERQPRWAEVIEATSAQPDDVAPATATTTATATATNPANQTSTAPADGSTTEAPDVPHTVVFHNPTTTTDARATTTTRDTPATPAVLLGVMDWIRREADRFWGNDLPTPDPRQVVQGTGSGVVVGTMNTTDEENDRLSFFVTDQPKHGRVTVYSDGSWVYTPNKNIAANLTASGWTDSFNIRVIDHGFNLRKIQDFLRGDAPGVSLPVNVTVAGYTGRQSGQSGTESLSDGAVATAAAVSAAATVTQRFEVVNASSRPIKLVSYGDHLQNQVTLSPPEGAILQPGEKHEFDVVFYFLGLGQVNPTYSTLDGSATWKMRMAINLWTVQESRCEVSGAGACNKYGTPLVMMDQPGGRIEIPAGQGQKQAEALNLLCKGDTPATCSFEVKQQDKTAYAAQQEVWSVRTAETKTDVKRTVEFSNSTSHSVEIGAKAGVTIKKIVELEISAKYTAKLEETVKNSTTIESSVPPWTHKVLLAEQAVTRYTGDFTVKLGNTTYYLRDVYFDVPDSTRAVRYREVSTPVPH